MCTCTVYNYCVHIHIFNYGVHVYKYYIYIYIKYGITKQINAMTEEDSLFSFFTVYYSKSADKS